MGARYVNPPFMFPLKLFINVDSLSNHKHVNSAFGPPLNFFYSFSVSWMGGKGSTCRSQNWKKFNLSLRHLFHRIQTIGLGSFSSKNFKLFFNLVIYIFT